MSNGVPFSRAATGRLAVQKGVAVESCDAVPDAPRRPDAGRIDEAVVVNPAYEENDRWWREENGVLLTEVNDSSGLLELVEIDNAGLT